MFCASQNLLAGVYRDPSITKTSDPQGCAARKEDTDRIFDDALASVSELLLYCSPLRGKWKAPNHPFLLPSKGEPPADWVRSGPGAMTRAWCMFEIVTALGKGCELHVVLSPSDTKGFTDLLLNNFDKIAGMVAGLNAEEAQISKVEDREYILGKVEGLQGGLGTVTATACDALRKWLVEQGQRAVEGLTDRKRKGPKGSTLLNNLGLLLQDQGDLQGAEKLLREALEVRRQTLGDRHPHTLISINHLGMLLNDQGDLQGAEKLLREALEVRRQTLGDRHPHTLISINHLGMLLNDQGDLQGAEKLLREALEVRRQTLGDRHPHTLISINHLGMLLNDQGDLQGAEKLLREALEVRRQTLGDRHPHTLISINHLGMLLNDQGDLQGAEKLLREALEVRRQTLGDRHPHTLISINHLGMLLNDQGDLQGAEKLLREALEVRRQTLGDRHPHTLISINHLGMLLNDQGDLQGAEKLL
uniref:Uncharacterized protein n=1 Tax=Chromera velia CCMP2878 TaxID=1169474 RepID=A0A0G4F4S4_9ALVE|eukprot:Cvel_15076.t1-p1 / transcript=Cvel_15076.t1 / gene=Cvel_15076 / organism=Chromera_velia_CCMP2878 / gene_product=Nephrocystin-3, putative / transcript_product=Nephrocystin-3, putative / location=Cvel_scaffold1099:43999-45420(-) / protein_length=474 / sequence_SO=supercontig / SO=protein_coding / is_pseudo=false